MKNKIFVLLMIFCVYLLSAKYSDTFFIGDYSQVYYPEYFQMMKEAHFNNLRVNTDNWYLTKHKIPFYDMVNKLDSLGFDVTLGDKDLQGPYFSSYGNYYRFEAEYTIKQSEMPSHFQNSSWFYGIDYDKEANVSIINDRNIKVLQCKPSEVNKEYYAWKDLKVRETMSSIWLKGKPVSYLTGIIITHPDTSLINTLYFRYRIKAEGAHSGPLFDSGLKIAVKDGKDLLFDYDVSQLLTPDKLTNSNDNCVSYSDFKKYKNDEQGYVTIEFRLSLNQLKSYLKEQGISLETYWDGKILYLCPTFKYKNNGIISLDYIEIEDNLHHQLKKSNSVLSKNLRNRLAEISRINRLKGNIVYLESRDEPLPSQFNSHKIVNSYASKYQFGLITAINCYGMNYSDNRRYDLINHFVKETQTDVICPDFYLYGNEKKIYNSQPPENDQYSTHIQTVISNMCNHYNRIKSSMKKESNQKFIPVVQSFGQWSNKGYWNGIMLPPNAQQSMLLYLPLCYGIDGLSTFRMLSNTDLQKLESNINTTNVPERIDQGNYDYKIAPIIKNYGQIKTLSQFYVIKNALNHVKKIGTLLKKTDWKSGGTIHKDQMHIPNIQSSPLKIQASVIAEYDMIEVTPNYVGYVEYGAYQNSQNEVYLMLVNRRTNKRVKGDEGKAVTQLSVNSCFSEASPQSVLLKIKNMPKNWKVINCITNEAYSYSTFKEGFLIELKAGEGLLVKIGKN
ncbi:MAG TPA: hypothetical protein PK816_04540 [Candidatus Cloacimonadota bacterium]|nr:hypothetical protein [Candidatus Cloacimonadota bacterium]